MNRSQDQSPKSSSNTYHPDTSRKHGNSTRKKGRFRVRRVSRTPDNIFRDNLLKREASESPVKSAHDSITSNSISTLNTINKRIVSLSNFSLPAHTMDGESGEKKMEIKVYDVSKLLEKSFDRNLASSYILDESGKHGVLT